jgi:TusA-related sulfurtransferase
LRPGTDRKAREDVSHDSSELIGYALKSGEVLEVITTNSSGANYRNIVGQVSAGTVLTVDTIANCKISRFNILKKEYVLSAVLKRPSS